MHPQWLTYAWCAFDGKDFCVVTYTVVDLEIVCYKVLLLMLDEKFDRQNSLVLLYHRSFRLRLTKSVVGALQSAHMYC